MAAPSTGIHHRRSPRAYLRSGFRGKGAAVVASVAAGRPRAGRWILALAPVATAVVFMVVFGLAGGAAGVRSPTNPAVAVPGLLSPGDAGRGWTATHSGALGAEPAGCFRPRATLLGSSPRSVVGILLTGPAGIPQVDEIAARYATASQAAAAVDAVTRTFHGCAGPEPVSIPVDAGRSAAALVTADAGPQTAGVDFVVAQRGKGVVLLVYGTEGVPDSAAVSQLADRALVRLGP